MREIVHHALYNAVVSAPLDENGNKLSCDVEVKLAENCHKSLLAILPKLHTYSSPSTSCSSFQNRMIIAVSKKVIIIEKN